MATVTRCLEARGRGGDGCGLSPFLTLLLEEIICGMRVIAFLVPVLGRSGERRQRYVSLLSPSGFDR